jgi:hypothetical protein
MQKLLAAGLSLAIFIGCAEGAAPHLLVPGQEYTLHFRPPLQKRAHYVLKVDMGPTAFGIEFSTTAIKHVAGKYTLVTIIDSMNVPGGTPVQMKKMIADSKLTEVIDEHGKVLSSDARGPMKQMMQGASVDSAGAVFPQKPVRVGDSWAGTSDSAGPKATVRVTLASVKTVGGKQFATLRMVPTSKVSLTFKGPIVVMVEISTGVLRSMEITASMGSGTQSAPLHMTLTQR